MKTSRVLITTLAIPLSLMFSAVKANAADQNSQTTAPGEQPPMTAPAATQGRATYDSSTDRISYPDNQGVRSGTTSSDGTEDGSARVHEMNRPTRIDSPSNTTAPAMGEETER